MSIQEQVGNFKTSHAELMTLAANCEIASHDAAKLVEQLQNVTNKVRMLAKLEHEAHLSQNLIAEIRAEIKEFAKDMPRYQNEISEMVAAKGFGIWWHMPCEKTITYAQMTSCAQNVDFSNKELTWQFKTPKDLFSELLKYGATHYPKGDMFHASMYYDPDGELFDTKTGNVFFCYK